jgi:cytochrome c biogenesis protein CcmG, thiol:disulfide interchange protein DsbE
VTDEGLTEYSSSNEDQKRVSDGAPQRSSEHVFRMVVGAAIMVALVGGWLLLGGGIERLRPRNPAEIGLPEVGEPAPDFALQSVSGEELRVSSQRGQVVLVNFWATWCVPCRSEMPAIERVYRQQAERGFRVVAVDVQESESEVQPFMTELNLTFPAVLDRDGYVSRLYRARALPSSFLIDRQGIIRFVRVGALSQEQLEEQLKLAL